MSSPSTQDPGHGRRTQTHEQFVAYLNALLILIATAVAAYLDLLTNIRLRELVIYLLVQTILGIALWDFIFRGVFIASQWPIWKTFKEEVGTNPPAPADGSSKEKKRVWRWAEGVPPSGSRAQGSGITGGSSEQYQLTPPSETAGPSTRRSTRPRSQAMPRSATPLTVDDKKKAAEFNHPFNIGATVSSPFPAGMDLFETCKVVDFAGIYLKAHLPGAGWPELRNRFKDYFAKTLWHSMTSLLGRRSESFDPGNMDEEKLWEDALKDSAWEADEGSPEGPAEVVLDEQKVVWLCEVKRAYDYFDNSPQEKSDSQKRFLLEAKLALCEQVGYLFSAPNYQKVLVLAFAGSMWSWALIQNNPDNQKDEFTIDIKKVSWSRPAYICSKDSFRGLLRVRRELFKTLDDLNLA